MTFNPLAALAVARTLPDDKKSVVEFGNQRLTVTKEMYGKLLVETGIDLHAQTTQSFYEKLGFETYLALDVNQEMGAIIADLNEPVNLGKTFSLVTNNGTGEHIFDQAAVFENAHNLCSIGGTMLHVLPMLPWLNHGFYNYTPVLFRDLARANQYEIRMMAIGNRWGHLVELDQDWAFKEKHPVELKEAIDSIEGDVFVVASFKKVNDKPFRKPLQGKYGADVRSDVLARRYG